MLYELSVRTLMGPNGSIMGGISSITVVSGGHLLIIFIGALRRTSYMATRTENAFSYKLNNGYHIIYVCKMYLLHSIKPTFNNKNNNYFINHGI